MSRFAEVINGKVIRVIVIEQSEIDTGKWGDPNNWIQTSYNTKRGKHKKGGIPLRGNFAGVGYEYDRVNDLFLIPKPYPSFVLDKATATYKAPIDKPLDGQLFKWNEEFQRWDEDKQEWKVK